LEKFFRRTLVLPIETSTSLDRVVVQDLVAKTPFRLQDIYQDYVGSRTTIEGKIVVSQSVIRREFVNDAILPLGLDVDSLTFIEAEPEANQRDPPILITLSSRQKDRTRWLRPTAWGLILSTVVLSFIAAGSQYWRRQAVLDELRTRVEAARPKAQQVRSVIDRSQQQHVVISRLRARRVEPRLIDIWEDATRILPSHSWLTELRLFETPDKRERPE